MSGFRRPAGGLYASVLLLAFCASGRPAASASSAPRYDWCSAVAIRPDQRWRDTKACVPFWAGDEIARGAGVLLIGDFDDPTNLLVSPGAEVLRAEPRPRCECAAPAR